MNAIVKDVLPGSPASKTIITKGDILRKINGNTINDVLDYKYRSYDSCLLIELTGAGGGIKLVRLRKPEGADVGMEFDTFLMDKERSCANKCIFCFIDQLPKGMRKTLYYKDDDARLSFFQGNYVTLTNLSKRDIERMIELHVSPINVSVHTLDPELRSFMLGTKNGAAGIDALKALASSGITLNCQIVCCPGINDGQELDRALKDLLALGPSINSVAVVPVGLTKHRRGLAQLRPFNREMAIKTVGQVNAFGDECMKNKGARVFYCADELYIKAGLRFPPDSFYEGYPQLENGVGMMRLFITEFERALAGMDRRRISDNYSPYTMKDSAFSIVTGIAAYKYFTKLLKMATKKCDKINGRVYTVRNEFFGESVTVSGLITGGDIINQLKGCELGSRLLIPCNMLRSGDDVFLDDVTVEELSKALKIQVRVVKQDGADLLHAILQN